MANIQFAHPGAVARPNADAVAEGANKNAAPTRNWKTAMTHSVMLSGRWDVVGGWFESMPERYELRRVGCQQVNQFHIVK